MKQQSMSLPAWISLLSLAFIWGGSFLAYAIGLRELPVFTLIAHRVFWGAIVLWGVVIFMRLDIPKSPRIWAALFIMGLLNNAIPFSLIAWGQIQIESGLASILNGSTAIFGVVLAAIAFSDERLTSQKTIGVLIAFLGVCITIGPKALLEFDIRSVAQLAVLTASFSYGLATVWARLTFKGLNPIVASTGMVTGAAATMVPLAYFIDGTPSWNFTVQTWSSILFLGIPATAIAYLLYYKTLNLAGSGNLSLVTLLVIPTAVLLGWLFLDEKLSIGAFVGFGLVAIGMLILDGRILKHLKFIPQPD